MTFTGTMGKILDRIAPPFGARARAVWYMLNGERIKDLATAEEQRFRDIKETNEWRFRNLDETNEWRFRNLKDFLRTTLQNSDSSFAIQDSIDRLARLGDSEGTSIAVVSVVPPSKTGIANFTTRTFGEAGFPVDIFFPHSDTAEYLAAVYRLGGAMQFFSMQALDAGIATRNYKAVIWVLGNSEHNTEVAGHLRRGRHFPNAVPYFVQIHDPVLLHLAYNVAILEDTDFSFILQKNSDVNLSDIDWERAQKGDHTQIVERGATGVRALLNDVQFDGLIFHSIAARDFVLRDWKDLPAARSYVLFHPVFDKLLPRKPAPQKDSLCLGSFGVPGRHKETQTIVEAFRELRKIHPKTKLFIVGYDMAQYIRNEHLDAEPGLVIEDSPNTEQLLKLMQKVDIAIQLRSRNTGESSGVIPQLLSVNTMVVASAVGAMNDYGDAVRYVEPGCSPATLVNVILDEIDHCERRAQFRADYVLAHPPKKFCDRLFEIIDLYSSITAGLNRLVGNRGDHGISLMPTSPMPWGDNQLPNFGSSFDKADPKPALWHDFEHIIHETGMSDDSYVKTHLRRYCHTLTALEEITPPGGGKALEVGTSWLFAILMRTRLGFLDVNVTDFKPNDDRKVIPVELSYPSFTGCVQAFNVNLEADPLPAEDESYDFVLCCEVLEHMDVDPMFMLAELNRVMRNGAKLLLTTPNVTSSRNVAKILQGYAPHFFMQYHKDRTPYRHNIEYAPDQVAALIVAAGFRVDRLWTADTFEEPAHDAVTLLGSLGFPAGDRGDDMFVLATKETAVRDRFPSAIYV